MKAAELLDLVTMNLIDLFASEKEWFLFQEEKLFGQAAKQARMERGGLAVSFVESLF
jgi:hypothetical protein